MNKKAISPLIATVLLIGFVVALAVLVTNWGLNYVKETTERTEKTTQSALDCINKLDFDITEVACDTGKVTIDNKGDANIMNITFRVHKIGDIIPTVYPGVPSFGVKNYFLDLAAASQVDAIATIEGEDGSAITCNQIIKERKANCMGS